VQVGAHDRQSTPGARINYNILAIVARGTTPPAPMSAMFQRVDSSVAALHVAILQLSQVRVCPRSGLLRRFADLPAPHGDLVRQRHAAGQQRRD